MTTTAISPSGSEASMEALQADQIAGATSVVEAQRAVDLDYFEMVKGAGCGALLAASAPWLLGVTAVICGVHSVKSAYRVTLEDGLSDINGMVSCGIGCTAATTAAVVTTLGYPATVVAGCIIGARNPTSFPVTWLAESSQLFGERMKDILDD